MTWKRGWPATRHARPAPVAGYGDRGVRLRSSPFIFGLYATAGGILAIVAFLGVRKVGLVLAMLVAAMFFAIGLDRPVTAMVGRGMRRGAAVMLIALAGLVFVCTCLAFGLPAIADQATAFFNDLPGRLHSALQNGHLDDVAGTTAVEQEVLSEVNPGNVAALATGLLTGAASVVGLLVVAGTTALLTLFILAGLDRLRAGALSLVVASRRDRVGRLAAAVQEKVGGYLVGAFTIAAFAGTAALIFTLIAGVPYPFLMAVAVALFDLIPQIGATIGSLLVILVALSVSLGLALATLVFFSCYQAVENWVVYPRMMSRAVKITNLAAIVSAMIGWAMFGVLGVLIAVPAYASVQLLVREVVVPRQDAR